MASKIHAALEEGLVDKEQGSRALRISVVSGRASYLSCAHLGVIGKGLAS